MDGTLNNDKVARAILQYHNTPLRDGPMSPAQLLFGRALADFLPVNPKAYQLHPFWKEEINKRQTRRVTLQRRVAKRYNIGTRRLRPLAIGQHVLTQHHTTKRWNRSAVVLEVLPHRKYKVRMNDTGNTAHRNRRHLKPTNRSVPAQPITHHSGSNPDPIQQSPPTPVLHPDTESDCIETNNGASVALRVS